MSKFGNWYREQKRYFRFWREHRKEILRRTRAHTIRGMVVYFTALAGLMIVALVRPGGILATISFIGLSFAFFGSLWWVAKHNSKVINELKKESHYE